VVVEEAGGNTKLAIWIILLVFITMDASAAARINTTVAKASIHAASTCILYSREKVLVDIHIGKDLDEAVKLLDDVRSKEVE
jgi:hypothetical protein